MSKRNTEIKSDAELPEPAADAAIPDKAPEISETSEPSEQAESSKAEAAEQEETPEEIVEISYEQDKTDQARTEAYEKLYADILEHFRSFSPAEQIAGKITEEHITEYLEANREERIQQYKERREKRLLAALELIAVLGTIIAIVNFLRSDPAILVNILYIIGALGAFFLWKNPHNTEDKK